MDLRFGKPQHIPEVFSVRTYSHEAHPKPSRCPGKFAGSNRALGYSIL